LLIKHCARFGFFPFAFTVSPACREELSDEWMCELIGNDYKKITVRCIPQRISRKFGFGDLGLRMLPFLFFKLLLECKKEKPVFILYPVPPWHILIIAPIVKYLTGIRYGIDFIDPWVHETGIAFNFKQRASQWIARRLEGWVTTKSDIIFSVSEGINNNMRKRHPALSNKPMYAVPYGAERNDFMLVDSHQRTLDEKIVLRYIGAIWNDCYPVLDGLMPAFARVAKQISLSIEFYGTSYAGEGLAKTQLEKWIQAFDMDSFITEHPLRVSYRKAVQLTMDADLLFLIGGMQPYYAASKLMGLVVSGKPFLAFVHRDSFPAIFLQKLNYPYNVTYTSQSDELPESKVDEVVAKLLQLIANKDSFQAIDIDHPLVKENTAEGMSQYFLEKINNTL